MTTKANLVQTDQKRYKHRAQNSDNKISKPHTLKKKSTCYVGGKLGHHAPQCRKRVKTGNNGNPTKANLVGDDIIATVVSQAVTNSKNWVVDSGVTRHI